MGGIEEKRQKLIEASRAVLNDCLLENGAVVAANADKPYYPPNANDYRYVWPRDAAFILYAIRLLGEERSEEFCHWLLDRAEGFQDIGLFFRRYATHGACSWPEQSFQPDQAGALLNTLATREYQTEATKQAISVMADTLCRTWSSDHFSAPTSDLWEHVRSDETHGSFTYSLAACSAGLRAASKLQLDNAQHWFHTASQMRECALQSSKSGRFSRLTDKDNGHIDASLLGLIWPFRISDDATILTATVQAIGEELLNERGIIRFSGDRYDGVIKRAVDSNDGAGSWPLLTCWYAIALEELGVSNQARKVFDHLVNMLPDEYIPEQLFADERLGVKPLGWSHAMFVITCYKLGYMS